MTIYIQRLQQTTIIKWLVIAIVLGTTYSPLALADDQLRTRSEAIEIAKERSNNGRVLSVKKIIDDNGKSVYAIKIITNGRVKVYSVNEKPE